jgi:hypothetical protein
MLNDIFARRVEQHRYLLLRKPNIFAVKADIDIRNPIVILIKDELTVGGLWLIVTHDFILF